MSNKGESIEINGGKYTGCTGWLDADKAATTKMAYVIIKLKNGTEIKTRINKTSFRKARAGRVANSFEEAALIQNPSIERAMDKLAEELAKCNISQESAKEFAITFCKKIVEAIEKQEALGESAKWRRVTWTDANWDAGASTYTTSGGSPVTTAINGLTSSGKRNATLIADEADMEAVSSL